MNRKRSGQSGEDDASEGNNNPTWRTAPGPFIVPHQSPMLNQPTRPLLNPASGSTLNHGTSPENFRSLENCRTAAALLPRQAQPLLMTIPEERGRGVTSSHGNSMRSPVSTRRLIARSGWSPGTQALRVTTVRKSG